jgi:hypothetical protein
MESWLCIARRVSTFNDRVSGRSRQVRVRCEQASKRRGKSRKASSRQKGCKHLKCKPVAAADTMCDTMNEKRSAAGW